MSFVAETYYHLACDADGCSAVSPDPDVQEYSAWGDRAFAAEMARDVEDWIATDDEHLCPEHAYDDWCTDCQERHEGELRCPHFGEPLSGIGPLQLVTEPCEACDGVGADPTGDCPDGEECEWPCPVCDAECSACGGTGAVQPYSSGSSEHRLPAGSDDG